MSTTFIRRFHYTLNSLEIIGVIILSLSVLGMQFIVPEKPCLLCLLLRISYLGIACAFLLNLRFGLKPNHYAISLLFAFFTALITLRLISFHIYREPHGYAFSISGELFFYLVSLVVSVGAIIFSTIMIGIDSQYRPSKHLSHHYKWITHLLFLLVILTIMSNLVDRLY